MGRRKKRTRTVVSSSGSATGGDGAKDREVIVISDDADDGSRRNAKRAKRSKMSPTESGSGSGWISTKKVSLKRAREARKRRHPNKVKPRIASDTSSVRQSTLGELLGGSQRIGRTSVATIDADFGNSGNGLAAAAASQPIARLRSSPPVLSAGVDRRHDPSPPQSRAQATTPTGPAALVEAERPEELWFDAHAPIEAAHLSVHKKRVASVRSWLKDALSACAAGPRSAPPTGPVMLVLRGPPGCGKTATTRVLAAELGLDLCEFETEARPEWKPTDVHYGSVADDLRVFLRQASLLPGLTLAGGDGAAVGGQRLLLLEDLPVGVDSPRLAAFRRMIRTFLETSRTPMVVVLTDEDGERPRVTKLLGRDLVAHPRLAEMTFKPVAKTFITAALKRVAAARNLLLPAADVANIVERSHGDLRSAINALQFHFVGAAAPAGRSHGKLRALLGGQRLAKTNKRKKRSKGKKPRGKEAAGLAEADDAQASRDGSLSMFHSLGKVFHRRVHQDLAAIAAATGLPPAAYSLFLHQNMMPYFGDLDDVAEALGALSDADIIASHDWKRTKLLQEAISYISAYSVALANKHPEAVKFQPMHKPQLYQVQRRAREIKDGLANMAMSDINMGRALVGDRIGFATDYSILARRRLSTFSGRAVRVDEDDDDDDDRGGGGKITAAVHHTDNKLPTPAWTNSGGASLATPTSLSQQDDDDITEWSD